MRGCVATTHKLASAPASALRGSERQVDKSGRIYGIARVEPVKQKLLVPLHGGIVGVNHIGP